MVNKRPTSTPTAVLTMGQAACQATGAPSLTLEISQTDLTKVR